MKLFSLRTKISKRATLQNLGHQRVTAHCYPQIGTLRSNEADGNENVKKINNFARASRFLVHFFAHFCTTTTWKCLISRFMEVVNKQRRNFISLSVLGWGPKELNFRRVRLHLRKQVGRNNCDKDWKNANSLFKRRPYCGRVVES